MGKTKNIHYFSVANMDLRQMGGNESHIINNDDITIILNGCPHNATFLREGEIYQLPEPLSPQYHLIISDLRDLHPILRPKM